nr:hypothetical protein [Bombilactobacillus bombi]
MNSKVHFRINAKEKRSLKSSAVQTTISYLSLLLKRVTSLKNKSVLCSLLLAILNICFDKFTPAVFHPFLSNISNKVLVPHTKSMTELVPSKFFVIFKILFADLLARPVKYSS